MNNKIRSELEKIEIPDELHIRATLGVKQAKAELVEEGVTTAENNLSENKLSLGVSEIRKKSLYKRLSIIAASLIIVASSLTLTPVRAAIQEVYDKLFSSQHIDDSGVRTAVIAGEGQVLDQTFFDKNQSINVNFERVLMDDKETKLLLTFQSKKTDLKNVYIDLFEGESSINLLNGNEKKKLDNVGWGSRYYDSKENKVVTALSFESLKDYEGKDIRLEIDTLTVWKDEGYEGIQTIWPLEFTVKPTAISERKTLELNKQFTYKGETYTVTRVEFSKLETRVVVTGSDTEILTDDSGMEYRVMSKLEHQFLNARKISKEYGYSVDEKKSGVFIASKGDRIDPVFSKGEVEGEKDEYIMIFGPVQGQNNAVLEIGDDVTIPLNESEKVEQITTYNEKAEIEKMLSEYGYTLVLLTEEEKQQIDLYHEKFPKELSIERTVIGKVKDHENSKLLEVSLSERSGVLSESLAEDAEAAKEIRKENGLSFIPIYLNEF
ncbi:DUF4179 domain-containing protein [Bacillus salacetis]|uniref:DUF4179 domain-containing protein n=1 Tax=Bacillus salacetis TaxID=2315464 RepID=A0A3A1QQY4_9BACI|nr:DUF4179 domain-containing protein [Bacillus salacetis]RIW28696.1 DUF4179 domain-containing protein [Bacillus salacetis]